LECQYLNWFAAVLMVAPIEAPFELLEKPMKIVRFDAIESSQMSLGLVPKVFDPVDVISPVGEDHVAVAEDGTESIYITNKDLDDGAEGCIPENAISVTADADGNSEVRFVVNSYTDGLTKNANDQPWDFGYKLELY
jgi:hypothetical protein